MPFCHLHKNAAHFSQLWMRAIFGPKCKFIRYFVHSVLGQRARKYTQYMIRISPIENYEDFLKLVSQTSRSDSSFFCWHSRRFKIQFEKSPRLEFTRMAVFSCCCCKLLISFYRIVLFNRANCIHSCKCRIFNLINIFLELLLFTFRSIRYG